MFDANYREVIGLAVTFLQCFVDRLQNTSPDIENGRISLELSFEYGLIQCR